MLSIYANIKILATKIIIADFKNNVEQTWKASGENPDKFTATIQPVLKRIEKSKPSSYELKKLKDAVFIGTGQEMELIQNPYEGFTVIEAVPSRSSIRQRTLTY